MILYHGSDVCFDKFKVSKSRSNLDFGKGIYFSDNYSMTKIWVERRSSRYIYIVEWDEEYFYKFTDYYDWFNYYLYNREIFLPELDKYSLRNTLKFVEEVENSGPIITIYRRYDPIMKAVCSS